mgnify:CR=1 FL=1
MKKLCFNFEKIKSDLKNNIKLKMFIVAFVDEYNKVILGNNEVKIKKKIYDIKNSSIVPNNIWALRNIYDLDKEYLQNILRKILMNMTEGTIVFMKRVRLCIKRLY